MSAIGGLDDLREELLGDVNCGAGCLCLECRTVEMLNRLERGVIERTGQVYELRAVVRMFLAYARNPQLGQPSEEQLAEAVRVLNPYEDAT